MEIALNNYSQLLLQIQKTIEESSQDIARVVNREKVEMSWNIGKIINDHLLKNDRANYGTKLFAQLESDLGISKRMLYQMTAFYKSYPEIPSVESNLSWTHYRTLLTVKDEEQRKYFEELVNEENLGSNALQEKILEEKNLQKKSEAKNFPQKPQIKNPVKLKFTRGKIFTYQITTSKDEKKFVDCGFDIFSEIETKFNSGDEIFESVKENGEFILQKSNVTKEKIHTYKAFVDKVVDGDTLNVTLDLGFKIRHKEILRLAKINAPESDSKEGKKSTEALKEILKNIKFLVVKTNKTDIYGRYVADIFFLNEENDPQKIAEEGIYLNQLLLDLGFVNSI